MTMFEKRTGEIIIGEVKIGPKFTMGEFVQSSLNTDILSKDENNYINYYLRPQYIGDDLFITRILFDIHGKLSEVLLSITKDSNLPSWENWSSENEQSIKKENDLWLSKIFGPPPYEFNWGKIISVYDHLAGSSYIRVIYTL